MLSCWLGMVADSCRDGVDQLVEWYIKQEVAGIFTVCLSSEMYHLTPKERLELAKRVGMLHSLQD